MIISTLLVIIMMASLVISAFALANSMMLEQPVYAVDDCDATSTCSNGPGTGIGNIQTNECTDSSTCSNFAVGDGNTQTNSCDSASGTEVFSGP